MCGKMPKMHADNGAGNALCKRTERSDFVFNTSLFWAFSTHNKPNNNTILHAAGIYLNKDANRCKACENALLKNKK